MKKLILTLISLTLAAALLTGCSTTTADPGQGGVKDYDTITIVWYPNESGNDLKGAREELGAVIETATGKKVNHQLTTDYAIAIETIANGNAHLAFMGAQGYVEARNKNNKVTSLVVPTGKSGTLDDAVYYSWLIVKKGNEGQYQSGNGYAIDNIQGKRFSFVSNSSTSGFVIPSSGIIAHFSKKSEWSNLKQEDLLEGGANMFFQEVLFGGSHQGSAVNVLTDRADIGAVCDTCVANYIEPASGEVNKVGTVYRVTANAAEPFNTLGGEEFVAISVTPVLNAPFVVNTAVLSEEDQTAILEAMTSDAVANNQKIFIPKDSEFKGLFSKTANERFAKVEDSWFNPIRELK